MISVESIRYLKFKLLDELGSDDKDLPPWKK